MNPVVTIALPVYNGASTLKLTVNSILRQSFQNWELIILDDGSTDNSLELMRSFNDPRIRLVEGEENIGLSARLNMAMDMAKGSFFARMDSDDVSFPQRIEKQLDYFESHQDVDLLATNYVIFNDDFEWLGKLSVKQQHDDICRKPWNGFYMPHPTWMGKLEWFKRYRYKSYADGAEDQNLLLRSYASSHFACMDEVLLAYRQSDLSLIKKLKARVKFVQAASHSNGEVYMLIRVFVTQLAKGCGDIVNSFLNSPRFQRVLVPLQDKEKMYLQKIFAELNEIS